MSDTENIEEPKAKTKSEPKAKNDPEILVATDSVALDWDGQPVTIISGRTTARAGHPILKNYGHLFKPLAVDFELGRKA